MSANMHISSREASTSLSSEVIMAIQYAHAHPGYEFKPTQKGIRDYWMDKRFEKKPEYKQRLPKHWLAKEWVRECRTGWIK